MLDLAWSEILLIIIIAVVIIGPRELPGAIRGIADGLKKAKRQFAQFQQQADELVREAKLEDVRNQIAEVKGAINEIRRFNLEDEVRKTVDADGTLTKAFEEDPLRGGSQNTPAWTPPPTARDTPDAPAMIPPQTMAPYKPPEPPPAPPAPAFLPPSTPAPPGLVAEPSPAPPAEPVVSEAPPPAEPPEPRPGASMMERAEEQATPVAAKSA